MNEAANLLGGFLRKSCLTATFTDLGRDVFHPHTALTNGEHLAHRLVLRGGAAADMAFKHGYLPLQPARVRLGIPLLRREDTVNGSNQLFLL
jgi:hypothetical protein